MNLEDLNLSCISNKNSMTDLAIGGKNNSSLEWRYSDCLKLNNNINNKEVSLVLLYEN